MTHQSLLIRPAGAWCYHCKFCTEVFTSSQGLAGHQRKHRFQDTWKKGARHHKFFCPSAHLPLHYHYFGKLKSLPMVLPNHELLYHPPMSNSMVERSHQSPSSLWPIFDPLQQSVVLKVPPQPRGHSQGSDNQLQQQQTIVQVTQQPSHGQISYFPNPPQQREQEPPRGCMSYGEMVQVPYVNSPAPITPTLIKENVFFQNLNQLDPYEIQWNLNIALAVGPLELTHSSIGSTSKVTAGLMCGEKNDGHEIEKLDLELRL